MPDRTGQPGDMLDLPIIVDDITGLGIISIGITLTYDESVLTALSADTAGKILSGCSMFWFNVSGPGTLRVAAIDVTPFSGSGPLVDIIFVVDSTCITDTTMIHFENTDIFNEGNIAAELYDGRVFVLMPVVLALEPDATWVARGGTLGYTVYVTNNTNEPKLFYYYTNVTLPTGSTYPPPPDWLFFYGPVTIPSGATRNAHLVHNVPNSAPIGYYTYNAFIGLSDDVCNEAHFDFTVTTASTRTPLDDGYDWKVIENGFDRSSIKGTMSSNAGSMLFTSLGQSYPNPFKGSSIISYRLATTSHVKLEIYDAAGQLVTTLVNETQVPGCYTVSWDGRDSEEQKVIAGVYFYHFETNGFKDTKKLILLR